MGSPVVLTALLTVIGGAWVGDVPASPAVVAQVNNPIALVEEANKLREKNQLAEAVRLYRQAIAINPSLVSAHYGLGVALRQMGDLNGAIAAHRQALNLDKNYAPAYYGLGVALYSQGDYAGAITAYREVLRLNGANPAAVYFNIGLAEQQRKNLTAALTAFQQAIALDADYAPAYNGLASVLYQQRNWRGRSPLCKKPSVCNRKMPTPSSCWGWYCLKAMTWRGQSPPTSRCCLSIPASPTLATIWV